MSVGHFSRIFSDSANGISVYLECRRTVELYRYLFAGQHGHDLFVLYVRPLNIPGNTASVCSLPESCITMQLMTPEVRS